MISSTLSSWALLIWDSLKEKGIDPGIAFERAALDKRKLGDCLARYNTDKMSILWQESIALTGDEDFGIAVGQRWAPTTFHALGFAWLASYSLLDAFQRLVRYEYLLSHALKTELKQEGAFYRFSFLSTAHPAAEDAAMTCIITMCRALTGKEFNPSTVEIRRAYRQPGVLESYAGTDLTYNSENLSLTFNASIAEQQLPTGNTSLITANEKVAQDYLIWLNKHDILSKVKSLLTEGLPTGTITEEVIAKELNMNVRTLQRKLEKEGYSFSMLMNETRKQIALTQITNNQLSLTEIAYLLGFSDQANFTRAFKRWTGKPPSTYRSEFLSSQSVAL